MHVSVCVCVYIVCVYVSRVLSEQCRALAVDRCGSGAVADGEESKPLAVFSQLHCGLHSLLVSL